MAPRHLVPARRHSRPRGRVIATTFTLSAVSAPIAGVDLCVRGLLLAGCGGGEIESSRITEARILSNQPATFCDGGEPVTGTVVEKTADGATVRRTEYVDGFPSGRVEEWHPNGQKKSERVVAFVARGPQDGGLRPAGSSRTWCDNGTLQSESDASTDGTPKGVSRTFTCSGEPLSEQTMPFGPVTSSPWSRSCG